MNYFRTAATKTTMAEPMVPKTLTIETTKFAKKKDLKKMNPTTTTYNYQYQAISYATKVANCVTDR
jgi:hypothetical protein